MTKPVPYADIADLEEDQRIMVIGQTVTLQQKVVTFITDSDLGKAERYIEKLTEKFPDVEILGKGPGPVPNTIAVKVGPKGTRQ